MEMLSVIVILLGIILYAIAYWGYIKWFDKNVIMSDPKRETPAHTYMDGVEFFPSNKYVLFGFQWKSIAALGPVVDRLRQFNGVGFQAFCGFFLEQFSSAGSMIMEV
jgi:carbon starvation protein CstA